jgi:hypothetical protein
MVLLEVLPMENEDEFKDLSDDEKQVIREFRRKIA